MSKKGKAPIRWGNRTEAHGKDSGLKVVYSYTLPVSTHEFVSLLDFGKENAVSAAYLHSVSGMTAREIRAETETARRAGVPVCAGNTGYYIALTESEKAACTEHLRQQARSLIRTAAALERAQLITDT